MALVTTTQPRFIPNIILGSVIWAATGMSLFLNQIETMALIETLFLLAPLVIIPLGLRLIKPPASIKPLLILYRIIWLIQPLGAVAAVVSFIPAPGLLAGGLAAAWLLTTLLIACFGLGRLWLRRRPFQLAEICLEAALLFLPVGGGWLVLSRLGINPLGFSDVIVLLTAVHFHYAGFAALTTAGMVGRILAGEPGAIRKLYGAAAWGTIAGVPLVAAGITFSPLLELSGAVVLATSLIVMAGLLGFVILPALSSRPAQGLLLVSAVSLLMGMLFTYAYAFGEFTGVYLITIPPMARLHGPANAVGFALCGLLGWNIIAPPPQQISNTAPTKPV